LEIGMARQQGRSPVLVVRLVLILAAVATWRIVTTSARANEASEAVHAQLQEIIAPYPVYGEHGQYIEGLLLGGHEQAFEEHYRVGFLVLPAQFEHSLYVEDVFALMVAQAREDGEAGVAEALQTIGENVDVEPP
jgi:hypothetical protein